MNKIKFWAPVILTLAVVGCISTGNQTREPTSTTQPHFTATATLTALPSTATTAPATPAQITILAYMSLTEMQQMRQLCHAQGAKDVFIQINRSSTLSDLTGILHDCYGDKAAKEKAIFNEAGWQNNQWDTLSNRIIPEGLNLYVQIKSDFDTSDKIQIISFPNLKTFDMSLKYGPPETEPTQTIIPESIVYVTLGSPFAADCGNGVPRIWSNDSFNASGSHTFDESHGHVDLFVPSGCIISNYQGEFIAPIDGYFSKVRNNIYNLTLPNRVYPKGIEDALKFVGITDPDLSRIESIWLNFGHIQDIGIFGKVTKGQSLGNIVSGHNQQKLAYQIQLVYKGEDYMMSPTLFAQNNEPWPCVAGSPYHCVATPNDYAK